MTGLQKDEGKYGLTGAVLKNIAYITMFVDHFFAVLFLNYMNLHPLDGRWDPQLVPVYRAGRAVGRIPFVLFTFLIVEGFFYTRSRVWFLMRLFLFALISEIPFDLALSGTVFDWSGQNVYWTLFLGVLVLTLWDYLSHYSSVWAAAGRYLVLLTGCLAAFFCSTDYRFMVMLFGTWASNLIRYVGVYSADYLFRFSLREMYGLLAFALIFLYNGEKGRRLPKLFYYGFYPVHLLILFGIAKMTGVM